MMRDILLDIKQRQNLDVYFTVVAALLVTVLGVLQVVDSTVVSSAVLAVLALVSLSLVVNRRENREIQDILSQIGGQSPRLSEVFQIRSQLPSLENRLTNAQSIDVAGMSLLAVSTSNHEVLLKKARNGCQIRLLLLNPANESLIKATCKFVAPLTPEAHRQEIVTSLNALMSDPEMFKYGNVFIRLTDYPLTHGLLSTNADRSDGQIRIEIYLHRKKPTRTPGFFVNKVTDPELFDTFQDEFNNVWENAIPYLNYIA